MKRQCVRLLTGIIASAFLSACGGGGGGGGGTPAPTPSAKKSSTVSGTVALVSLNSLVAKRTQKVSVRKAAGQDAAQVSIRSYDKNNVELGKYNLTTGTTGAFSQDIALSDTGGYVVITATKPGYADFSKRIDYDKPSALNLRAELAQAATGAGTPDTTNTNLIEIGVVRNTVTGSKSVYSGSALKAARKSITTGANEIVELDMKIDTTALPAGTNKVIGQFQTFNSTDPTQAQYFPGTYSGKETATSQPGKLVSMAFDYIDLTTNQGKNVFKEIKKLAKAGKTRKAASIVNKVTRWVPESSCENLFLQDGDASTPNQWDVPIWSVDPYAGDGTWLKIGDGVVSTSNGTSYSPVAISSSFTKDQAKTACKSGNYYVDITVTNPAYLEKWWNLDHIILGASPQEVCITGTIKDNGNIPLTDLWLYVYDEDYDYATNGTATLRTSEDGAQTFDYGYGVTDATGKFTLKAALFNSADTDRTATISYYDPISYNYNEKTVTLGLFDPATKTCSATPTSIIVTRPAVCTVSGTLSGASSTGELVTFYNGGSDYYYNYTYTDTGGNYTAEVPCGRELEVYLGYDWTSSAIFNVNGVTTDHADFEASDNGAAAGSKVTLKTLAKANTPPEAWGWLDSYYVASTATAAPSVIASIYAYDYEGNYPLSYTISYTNAAGKPVELKSGTITTESANAIDIPLTLPATAGTYNLSIIAKDSSGNTSSESFMGSVLVYDGSGSGFVPSVWLYADQYVINASQLGATPPFSLPLYAYASDLDGASTLSYSWNVKYNGVPVSNAVGTSGTILTFNSATDVYRWSNDAYATAMFTPPATVNSKAVGDGGVFTIEVTVSDNSTPTPNTATYFIDLKIGTLVTYPGTITIQKPAMFKRR